MSETSEYHPAAPRVSVIMAAYNGAAYLARSIDSVLAQSLRDFELIIGDDGSSDATAAILASYRDPRVRVFRNPHNLGVVATRNACFAAARAPYVAMLDHDDLMRPHRLLRQTSYLDRNPGTVLVATAAHELRETGLSEPDHPALTTPALIDWLLLLANQLVASSVMFRADAVRSMGAFMREDYRYADDYDLYLRLRQLGQIARIDERLTIYRLHPGNASGAHSQTMTGNAICALIPAYRAIFAHEAEAAAGLAVRHISAREPVENEADWRRLVLVFDRITEVGLAMLAGENSDAGRRLAAHARVLWRRNVMATAAHGSVGWRVLIGDFPRFCRPAAGDRLRVLGAPVARPASLLWRAAQAMIGPDAPADARCPDANKLVPSDHLAVIGEKQDDPTAARPQTSRASAAIMFHGTRFTAMPIDVDRMPRLYVIIDTEAEFDWQKPFARDLTDVLSMQNIMLGQEIFDHYGLRPIYFIDYPVASQEAGFATLRGLMRAGRCEIGAHLHPWTTPPFEETVDQANSFSGNLPAALEAKKIVSLIDVIERNFGVRPEFYRAGRYGLGPSTIATLAALDVPIDFSVLPGADLSPNGGPDFSQFGAGIYRAGAAGTLSVAMSREVLGGWPSLAPWLYRTRNAPILKHLHLPGIAARLRLSNTVTLTPEGISTREQKALIRHLLAHGERDFVMHYHSPSLSAGFTPYAKTQAESAMLLERIREVCRFFFEKLAGLPGDPRALVRLARSLPPPGTA